MKIARTLSAASLAAVLMLPAAAAADVVTDWNVIMETAVRGQNSLVEPRMAAMTHGAVFEAVNAITKKYKPYLGTVTAPPGASPEAAAVVAAHDVLVQLLPAQAVALTAARDASLAAIPDGQAKEDGKAVGAEAAAAMLANRTGDGSTPPQFHVPGPVAPGAWQATPSCSPSGGAFVNAATMTPFGLARPNQYRSGPPPRLHSLRWAWDFYESKTLGRIDSPYRPQDRTDVALYYAKVLGVGTWNPAVRQAAAGKNLSLTAKARLYALVNMALMDGFIAVMDTKYTYTFWRPETAIRAGHTDGNPFTIADPSWLPLIAVPCHPSYPSAHAAIGGAAREVAERILGPGGHDITLQSPLVPGITLRYSRFKDIARDIDDARIYGGVHYRIDQEEGGKMGRKVGEYLHRRLMRPRH
jgi:hypothetical protein